jgi:uncharacterized protein YkwD
MSEGYRVLQVTEPRTFRHFVCLLLLVTTPLAPWSNAQGRAWRAPPADSGVIASVNKVRAQGCSGRSGVRLPLRPSHLLDDVARQLAGGAELRRAQQDAGYHAVTSASVEISGVSGDGNIERIVARQFCAQSTNPTFREIGVYQRGANVWIALAQPFAPPAARDAAAIARRVLELTNEARSHARRCGSAMFGPAPALSLSITLERAALDHSSDMASHSYMDHTGRDGSTPADRVTRAGYKWRLVGENLASGIMTPEEAVAGWLDSPHHCANLMEPRFTQMGVAYAVNARTDAGVYWTQVFGRPR